MRPFFFDTFHERIARWPLNVEATIRAAGIRKVLAQSVCFDTFARWWNIDGRFFKLLPPKKMKPTRKKISRPKYLFLQDREEETPHMYHKDEERDGFTPYPMKFHSNRWAERLAR